MNSNFVWEERNPYGLMTGLSISKVQVHNSGKSFLFNCNCVFALGTNLKIKHKNKT